MRLLRSNFPPVLLGIALLLAGCGPLENTTTPISTLHPMRVAYSPDTRPALLALEQCAAHQPDLMALFDEMPVALMGSSPTDVWIRLGTPENWGGYAAQLAEERIGVVVNPDNPIQSLSLEDVRGVFSGQLRSWSQVGGSDLPIQVWVLPAADEASQISDKNLFGGLTISSQAYLATGPSLMLQAIANDPGAIGYLPGAWIDSSVKLILLPVNQQVALTSPLLALLSSEPEGQVREFVVCLQAGSGQKLLNSLYKP